MTGASAPFEGKVALLTGAASERASNVHGAIWAVDGGLTAG